MQLLELADRFWELGACVRKLCPLHPYLLHTSLLAALVGQLCPLSVLAPSQVVSWRLGATPLLQSAEFLLSTAENSRLQSSACSVHFPQGSFDCMLQVCPHRLPRASCCMHTRWPRAAHLGACTAPHLIRPDRQQLPASSLAAACILTHLSGLSSLQLHDPLRLGSRPARMIISLSSELGPVTVVGVLQLDRGCYSQRCVWRSTEAPRRRKRRCPSRGRRRVHILAGTWCCLWTHTLLRPMWPELPFSWASLWLPWLRGRVLTSVTALLRRLYSPDRAWPGAAAPAPLLLRVLRCWFCVLHGSVLSVLFRWPFSSPVIAVGVPEPRSSPFISAIYRAYSGPKSGGGVHSQVLPSPSPVIMCALPRLPVSQRLPESRVGRFPSRPEPVAHSSSCLLRFSSSLQGPVCPGKPGTSTIDAALRGRRPRHTKSITSNCFTGLMPLMRPFMMLHLLEMLPHLCASHAMGAKRAFNRAVRRAQAHPQQGTYYRGRWHCLGRSHDRLLTPQSPKLVRQSATQSAPVVPRLLIATYLQCWRPPLLP